MDLLIRNQELTKLGIVDVIKSVIWVRRYHTYDTFELIVPASEKYIDLVKLHNYVCITNDQCGIIESIVISQNEEGSFIKVSGCSLLGLLKRRSCSGMCTCISEMLNLNVISPANPLRRLPLFTVSDNFEDIPFNNSVVGISLTDQLEAISKRGNIGFSVRINPELKCLEFYSYKGLDRSYDQTENSRAIFSREFDNLLSIEHTNSDVATVNSVIVICKIPPGTEPCIIPTYSIDSGNQISRCEKCIEVDAITYDRQITYYSESSSFTVTKTYLDETTTLNKMKAEAINTIVSVVENIEGTVNFKNGYHEKYDLGDIVEVNSKAFNLSFSPRITEITENYDNIDDAVIPLFGSPLPTIMDLLKK